MPENTRIDFSIEAVNMKDIVMKFGDFVANDHVNICVHKGEIHAILGENGAGKSTLMNVLYGLYKPTSGNIKIYGREEVIDSPKRAISLGIGMVHQHFMLVQPYTVTENIILGIEPLKSNKLQLNMEEAKQKVLEISSKYGMAVDPDALIENISVGMQQRVEILKALYRGADILILDEPTASLTPQEIGELIDIMNRLAENGKSIIIITHKLKEIKASADFCTIIRAGKYIDTVKVSDVTQNDLANMMVGRNVEFKVDKKEQKVGDVVLEVKDLHAIDYRNVEILKGLNISVRAGEILGIAGIDGNGQMEMVEIITGLRKATKGEITILGNDIFNVTPLKAYRAGISSIPADRQKHGLVGEFSVAENMILQNYKDKKYQKYSFLKKNKMQRYAEDNIEKYDIRPKDCANKAAMTLSGGNQQKVIIAREVNNDKDVLIAVNPTRGLDVGAIEYVHSYLVAQRNKMKAVLLVSFELDEIISLSDRIAVIYDGNIVDIIQGKDADEKKLGLLMAGGGKNG